MMKTINKIVASLLLLTSFNLLAGIDEFVELTPSTSTFNIDADDDYSKAIKRFRSTSLEIIAVNDKAPVKNLAKGIRNVDKTIAVGELTYTDSSGNRVSQTYKSFSGNNNLPGFAPNVDVGEGIDEVNGIHARRLEGYDSQTGTWKSSKANPDAEFKIVNKVYTDIDPSAKGTLKIYVNRPPCGNSSTGCTRALNDFSRLRPDINVQVEYVNASNSTTKAHLKEGIQEVRVPKRVPKGASCK